MGSIRVMIVDDSALIRRSLSRILHEDAEIQTVETATDGVSALEKLRLFKPDVVLLDVHMPKMDGVEALQQMMRLGPVPVIMFSSLTTSGAEITLRALRLGAVDFLPKPRGSLAQNLKYLSTQLVAKVKAAKAAKIFPGRPLHPGPAAPAVTSPSPVKLSRLRAQAPGIPPLIVIGCSTGGPKALEEIIPALPADFPATIGIVQHMPEPFSQVFADHLDRMSLLRVKIARNEEPFLPGHVLMAPGNAHLRVVQKGDRVIACIEPFRDPESNWMPSIDSFFYSAARALARKTLGVLLTGMGRDGAKGMAAIKIMGGRTIAQDESTSTVFGMPRAAIESGTVDCVTPLSQIPVLLEEQMRSVFGYALEENL